MSNDSANTILDSHEYEVQFEDGEVTEVTANVIAESIDAQCDPEGNQYFLFDYFVDLWKKENALNITNQKIVVQRRPSLHRSTVGWQLCCQ